MTKHAKETNPNIVSRAEFARLQGVGRARISQLANDGRLVLAENGKDVYVIESLARIEATKDLSKIGTVERHAKAREQKKTQREIQLENELIKMTELKDTGFEHCMELHEAFERFVKHLMDGDEKLHIAIKQRDYETLSGFFYENW